MALLVLVATNGKTLQLDVSGDTRVDAVQQALVSFTGVPIAEQIVMFNGTRLDPSKTLGAYGLPGGDPNTVEDLPVFLYCRSYLRPGTAPPAPEVLPPLNVHVPLQSSVHIQHPLHSAQSPFVRTLPDYELQFQHHLLTGRIFWDAGQQCMQRCRQLLSEQEVQARAADAARANVEAHFTYICNSYQDFLDRYYSQHDAHSQLLSSFNDDLATLAAVELHPNLQTDKLRRLVDLAPASKLRDWADHCRRSHEHFANKVSELEGLFDLLKRDVEGLFLQAPSVDLDGLGQELAEKEGLLDEQSSIVQVLSKDLKTVKALVEDVVQQLGSQSLTGGHVRDMCGAMESINENHVQRLIPRVQECYSLIDCFCTSQCLACKNRMTADVMEQLQRISAQQSKIRDMKNKLAAFNEVLVRQETAFAELHIVTRVASSYRLVLAECIRRKAWQELFTSQAMRLAEHMVKVREREAAKREGFLQQVERYMPSELLVKAGLLVEPPHCQISVPVLAVAPLLVSMHELQRLPADLGAARASSSGRPAGLAASKLPADVAADKGEGMDLPQPTSMPSLEMENARLRAELANHIAAACIRDLNPPKEGAALSKKGSSSGVAGSAAGSGSMLVDKGGERTGSAAGTPSPRRSEQEAVATMHKALALKDDLIHKLQQEVAALSDRSHSYESRIAELEALIHNQSQHLHFSQHPVIAPQPAPSEQQQQQQQQPPQPRLSHPSQAPAPLGPIALAALSTNPAPSPHSAATGQAVPESASTTSASNSTLATTGSCPPSPLHAADAQQQLEHALPAHHDACSTGASRAIDVPRVSGAGEGSSRAAEGTGPFGSLPFAGSLPSSMAITGHTLLASMLRAGMPQRPRLDLHGASASPESRVLAAHSSAEPLTSASMSSHMDDVGSPAGALMQSVPSQSQITAYVEAKDSATAAAAVHAVEVADVIGSSSNAASQLAAVAASSQPEIFQADSRRPSHEATQSLHGAKAEQQQQQQQHEGETSALQPQQAGDASVATPSEAAHDAADEDAPDIDDVMDVQSPPRVVVPAAPPDTAQHAPPQEQEAPGVPAAELAQSSAGTCAAGAKASISGSKSPTKSGNKSPGSGSKSPDSGHKSPGSDSPNRVTAAYGLLSSSLHYLFGAQAAPDCAPPPP